MYYKIAPIILNSAKAAGLSDVFVAQPDSLKENLAGKIFVIAEIGGKKIESKKIFDFLILALNDNYYNDEKILFRDKIEGLKIENIFEAAITKTNKDLTDFLAGEKIKFDPETTNITLGVICDNKLHFTNFGRNRALLVYRRGEEYDIINVEADASEIDVEHDDSESTAVKYPKIFSSVISGEVPPNSYFVFTSEALPEYLSGKEMVNIITKLPPITAAGQIKNVLARINNYVPFLGLIIKNTNGINAQESREDMDESPTTQNTVSSLNYTEQKTEQMLAPAGLFSLSKVVKGLQDYLQQMKSKLPKPSRRQQLMETKSAQPALDLTPAKNLKIARPDSFLVKEKIYFKKKSGLLGSRLKNAFFSFPVIFSAQFWSNLMRNAISWVKNLDTKNRWLLSAFSFAVIILISSIIYTNFSHQRQADQQTFDNQIALIETQENNIDSHLLYNDDAGANQSLIEAQAALSSLPQKTKAQQEAYKLASAKLQTYQEKLQKIVKVAKITPVASLTGLGASGLSWANGKLYSSASQAVYEITPGSSSPAKIDIAGANNLTHPFFDGKDRIFYWDTNQIIELDTKTKSSTSIKLAGLPSGANLAGYRIFNDKLYLVAKANNQIYRYSHDKSGFSIKSDWLKDNADLSQAVDMEIDGPIYVLKNNGEVLKFFKYKKADFKSLAISPVMTGASKIIAGQKYLYIFEPSSKRIAVLLKQDEGSTKGGTLVNQYTVDSLTQAIDFTVNEAARTAYFLTGDAVYSIPLNQ